MLGSSWDSRGLLLLSAGGRGLRQVSLGSDSGKCQDVIKGGFQHQLKHFGDSKGSCGRLYVRQSRCGGRVWCVGLRNGMDRLRKEFSQESSQHLLECIHNANDKCVKIGTQLHGSWERIGLWGYRNVSDRSGTSKGGPAECNVVADDGHCWVISEHDCIAG